MFRRPPEVDIRQNLIIEEGIDERMAVETGYEMQSGHEELCPALGTPARSRVEKNIPHTVMAATEMLSFLTMTKAQLPKL